MCSVYHVLGAAQVGCMEALCQQPGPGGAALKSNAVVCSRAASVIVLWQSGFACVCAVVVVVVV